MIVGMHRGRTWRHVRDRAIRQRMADFARAARRLPAPDLTTGQKHAEIRSYMGGIARKAERA